MKKPQFLVAPSQARCISSREEVERLLAAGWLLARPKAKTRMAGRMRALRDRRRAERWCSVTLWFPPGDLAAIKAELLPGEGYAELVMRLVKKQSLM